MAEATFAFPRDFVWGTATSAHQVEGNNRNNDWWEWEQQGGGRIFEDQTSGPACDWWAGRAEEDIERMAALNTGAHRLSLEWSRIEPKEGQWDYAALDRYRQIIGHMRDRGIEPMVMLHHFTSPLWVAHRGGWLHPDAPQWFAAFVRRVVADLTDLVTIWCTIDEPNVYAMEGYLFGRWPPGMADTDAYFRVVRNLLEAHAAAYRVIHEVQPQAQVGLAHHLFLWTPRSDSLLDRRAAKLADRFFNAVTLDALATGDWRPPVGRRMQMDQLKGTLDWFGVNYYRRYAVWFSPRAPKMRGICYGARPDAEQGPEGWGELYPEGIFECVRRVYRQFGLPIYITGNGVPDGYDSRRPHWLLTSLRHLWRAVNFNWPVKGYFFWSLLDNFEWTQGYNPRYRFGLYGCDPQTQERTLRKSGELYAEIARTGTITTDMARRYAPEVVDTLFPGKGPQGDRYASSP